MGFFLFCRRVWTGNNHTSSHDRSALGVNICNSANVGGEASAYDMNDWRVLWLQKGKQLKAHLGRLGASTK